MDIEHLQQTVYRAHIELAASGLVMGTFGNLSAADRDAGVFVIKPSGVPYDQLTPAHMVPVSLETGEVVGFRPAPVVRHADASRAVPRVRLRGRRPHPLGVRDALRAGAHADPVHGHDPRGLFPR